MPHARCRMVVGSATKPRFGQQNVMMKVVGDEEAGIQKGVFTFQVSDFGDGESFFERGDEFEVEFAIAAEAEDAAEETEEDEETEETPETPPVPDVPVAELKNHIADVDDVATLKAWLAADDRTTAEPIYEARIAEIEGAE